ncbi:alkylglycerol monooxygenase-like [Gigantopelta aegis]|uniref:alkylglycerol monooxygenase-like n=1 Tax=Gigantopelta aegis TaxID=1735272 RepID=UPI001B889308|nr:alkylglycerol monooxygenase-like [Gigantopelta aegis]
MDKVFKIPFTTGLRRMFYLVTPNETSFATTDDVPLIVEEATPYFFVFIGLELCLSVIKQDKRYRMNDAITSVAAGVFSRLPVVVLQSITLAAYCWVYDNWRIAQLPWDSAWTWCLCFLGQDLGYYWFHRFAHEVNFMWAAHQVHHSSEDYNFSTALRQSILQVYTSWVFYLPMALCIPPSVFLIHAELNLIYQFWIHTQYVPYLGPLEYIINTPSAHRVHHGRNPYCIDKNYAGTLIIWDRIFGTYEAESEEVVYGLTHALGTFDPLNVQFGFLQYMVNLFRNYSKWTHKLASLFCGPGWSPGKPRMGDPADIPQVESPPVKYDTRVPTWLGLYVLVHFILINYGYLLLMANKKILSHTHLLMFLGFLGLSLSCFGQLFDRKKFGVLLEAARCTLFLLADIVLSYTGFYSLESTSNILQVLRILFVTSLMIWMRNYNDVFGKKEEVEKKK